MIETGFPCLDYHIATHWPSSENGIDSIAGGLSLLSLVAVFFAFVFRKIQKNRQAIADWLGLKIAFQPLQKHPDDLVYIWENILLYIGGHISAAFAVYLLCTSAKWQSGVWAFALHVCGFYSIPGGVHKLYSHRSFKPSLLYEIVVMIFNTILLQNDAIHWARDHRCHHKFLDTNADPTNISRGLLYSHCGFLLVERHPDVIRKGKQLDCSDLFKNPVLRFQRKYYYILMAIFHHFIPIMAPVFFWGERFWSSYFISASLPWVLSLNAVGVVNSLSHWHGSKDYNKNISAVDLPAIPWQLVTQGEGDHNFHHTFPMDYYGGEKATIFHISGNIIKLCSWLGLASDLRVASPEVVKRTKKTNGEKRELDFI